MYYLAQLHNVSEKYTIDLMGCIDSQQKKLSPMSNHDGYEIPIKIINNEYLELFNDKCEYLDLSTPTVNMVDNRDSEPESIPEDNLYCNMNPELIG